MTDLATAADICHPAPRRSPDAIIDDVLGDRRAPIAAALSKGYGDSANVNALEDVYCNARGFLYGMVDGAHVLEDIKAAREALDRLEAALS